MSECMRPVAIKDLLEWILSEFIYQKSIFGIPEEKFFYKRKHDAASIFGQRLDLPLGPAAGPHTQMSQNIVTAFLCGARFFELKTVQKLDDIKVARPCIDAEDEAYNVEWSQELSLKDSYREYLKAWFLIHFLNAAFGFSDNSTRSFVFNMSVGYDLDGIRHETMDNFIEGLKDASKNDLFDEYRHTVLSFTQGKLFRIFRDSLENKGSGKLTERVIAQLESISPAVSNSVTLSTMHGCPPGEIEKIAEYLLKEKELNTFVKLNPTLLGYDRIENILNSTSRNFSLDESSFRHDIKMDEAVSLIKNLQTFSEGLKKSFGIKLSNTLPVNNIRHRFAESQMYMSGRTLFPLTVNLAYHLAEEFAGKINISFSGGAVSGNILSILETGIYPVTLVTDLLKPGGYMRLKQMADLIEESIILADSPKEILDIEKLKQLAEDSLTNADYSKSKKNVTAPKVTSKLKMFDCCISPCVEACPIHQDIPEYISFIKEGNYSKAFDLIVQKNPLPNITGYICDHNCMRNCQRREYDEPVQIRELKKSAAENGFVQYMRENRDSLTLKPGSPKAAIIGGGPAGLTAAYFLAKAGFDVTVFETQSKAGGTVRHSIPNFRIPQSAIDRDVEFIEKHGVKFIYNIDRNFSVQKLKEDGYKYIYVAIGASESTEPGLSGTGRIYNAIEFLRSFNSGSKLSLGKYVAVIGGGNSAMDSARAAGRIEGVEQVYIIYRRTIKYMPADKEELEAAISEGINIKELLLPFSFKDNTLKCQVMELAAPEADGRMGIRAVNGSFEEIEIDTVISAIGEHTDYQLLRNNNLTGDEAVSPRVNINSNETVLDNVFIGGDALRGPSSVLNAISDGKKTAEYIIAKEGIVPGENGTSDNKKRDLSGIVSLKGNVIKDISNSDQTRAGACLNCNLLCNICVEVCPNRANIAVSTEDCDLFSDRFQILHIDSLCNSCGNCETFCPHEGSPFKDKLTLFYDEKSFYGSSNNGFLMDKGSAETSILARYEDETGLIMLDRFGEVITTSFEASLQDESFHQFIKTIVLVLKNYRYLIPGSSVKELYHGGRQL
ncbi:MAG: putative selenate reductase subunit YgfK [Syntrophomonadaceae bacterium]